MLREDYETLKNFIGEKFKEYWHSMADVGEIIDAYLSVPAQSAPNAE